MRPTTDRVKESLFASLQDVVVGSHVLDLYAGSGALGLEALSRGAASVTFVERDRTALDVLRRNLAVVALPGGHVVARPVAAALASVLPSPQYQLVLADPPYDTPEGDVSKVLRALLVHLDPGAVVVLERSARAPEPTWPAPLRPESARRYGEIALHRARFPPGAAEEQEPV